MRQNILPVFLQHFLEFAYGLGPMPGVGKPDGATVTLVFSQPVFGVRTGAGPQGLAAQIPEGAEARNNLRVRRSLCRPPFAVVKRQEPGPQVESHRSIPSVAVLRLVGI